MAFLVVDKQDIVINLLDETSVIIDCRYISKDICNLQVYYLGLTDENPSFISSCQYERGSGLYFVPFYYNNFDLVISTDDDLDIVVNIVDRSDG